MRTAPLIALLATLGLFGCSTDGKDVTDSVTTDETDDDTTDDPNDNADNDNDTGSGTNSNSNSGGGDTMVVIIGFEGNVTVDLTPSAEDFAGTETLFLYEADGVSLTAPPTPYTTGSGSPLCEYTHPTTSSGYPSTATTACTDEDGNACDWTFDVSYGPGPLTIGDGTYCELIFGPAPGDAFDQQLGLSDDFMYNSYSYGTTLLFYYNGTSGAPYYYSYIGWYAGTGGYVWGPGTAFMTWDASSGDLWYDWTLPYYYLAPSP